MRNSYLFIYNDNVGTREHVKSIIEKMSYVATWRYDMPNLFYIASDYSAADLASQFESLNGINGLFIFQEYTINAQGRLTGQSWYLLNNKKLQPE